MSEATYLDNNPQTTDNRKIVAINRIPAGYTVYPTGQADSLTTGFRGGDEMKFDADNKVKRMQLLGHWYGIGGRVFWQGADLDDSMSAYLKAPATVGTNVAGDYDKYDIGGGANMYIPASPGAGAWDLDLTSVHTGTDVLKCVPVPSTGNTGYFNYDSITNVLTGLSTATGGYNLFDFEATLFCFAHKVWGKKTDGMESSIEIPDVVGKLLFNSWVVEFTLTTTKLSGICVGVSMISAVKGNV